MLTIDGTVEGDVKLSIPNQVVREQIYSYLLATYEENGLEAAFPGKCANSIKEWLFAVFGRTFSLTRPIASRHTLRSATSRKERLLCMVSHWL